jgi:hypothetical protein
MGMVLALTRKRPERRRTGVSGFADARVVPAE